MAIFMSSSVILTCNSIIMRKKMNFNLSLLLILIVGLFFSPTIQLFGQEDVITVEGTVTDVQNQPIIGAAISISGTTIGTITDLDGKFILKKVKKGASLKVSVVGYLPQTITAEKGHLEVILREDLQLLDEVVVVGYGTQHKKDITGSVTVVDTKDLLSSTGSSATQQLQGKAAGVYVGQSGSPGSATMVRIRGINTVNDNGPLYVVDGVSTRNQNLSTLNPSDIESMQVLKDASSAAIYGAQAANGVILITTKKGSGKPRVTYDGYVGFQKTATQYDVVNSQDRLNLEWAGQTNNLAINGSDKKPSHVQFGTGDRPIIPNYMTQAGAGGSQNIDPSTYSYPNNTMVRFSDTDWWDEISRTGVVTNHQLGVSGGTDKGSYSISANYHHNEGTQIHTYFTRYQVRANTSFNVRSWLRMGENITYAFTKDNGLAAGSAEGGIYSWTYRASPWVPVHDIQGNFAGSKIAGTGNFNNPVSILTKNKDNYWTNNRLFGNLWAEADIIKNLTFRTSFGLDYRNNYSYSMNKKKPEFSEDMGRNDLTETSGFNYRWVWTNTATYNHKWNDTHNLTLLVGTEAIRDGLGRSMTGRKYGYLWEDNENTWTLDLGGNDNREIGSTYNGEFALFGIFGRVDYSFLDKYLITGIIRRDGVSRFTKDNRYGTFPSVSLGWRLSEESFMLGTKSWLDDLKLRFGYGQTGNSEIPRATNFASLYNTNRKRTDYSINGSNTTMTPGWRLGTYGNPETKWESTNMYNIGLDMTFLKNRFNIGLEWYHKKTTDMLISASYSDLAGEAEKPYINYGDIKNTGFDITLNYRDQKGDWAWDASLNVSHYKNKVLKLSDADDASLWGNGARLSSSVTRTTKGRAISEFYGYEVDGFYENAQEVLDCLPLGKSLADFPTLADAEKYVGKFKFKDVDENGKLNEDDRKFIGSPHPKVILGLNTNIVYKNFDLTTFWYSTIGNKIFNNTKFFTDFQGFNGNRSSRMRDFSWTRGGDNSKAILPILDSGDTYSGGQASSYYVEDGSFLRLKNLVIGYTFPEKILKKATISSLRVYFQVENVFTITGYDGLDPEFTNADIGEGSGSDLRRGLDMGGWPTTRKFLFGVNFAF